jgi:hypothetical protein
MREAREGGSFECIVTTDDSISRPLGAKFAPRYS